MYAELSNISHKGGFFMWYDKQAILEFVKLELGIKDDMEDILLNRYIEKAYDDLVLYLNNDFTDKDGNSLYPREMDSVIEDMVIYRYRNRGTEGKTHESIGNYSYTKASNNDIPPEIKKRITRFRKVRFY